MDAVNLSDGAELADVVARAEAGEDVTILRDGKPVARVVPVPVPAEDEAAEKPKGIDPEAFRAMRALTDKMTYQQESAGDFIRRMRDGDPY